MIEINNVHVDHERIIDSFKGNENGIAMICIAAVHGNEQAGILALKQIFRKIREQKIRINGEIVALRGNINGIKQNKRYISKDLNRIWNQESIDHIVVSEELCDEEKDLISIKKVIDSYIVSKKKIVLLDLHTMSSDGIPFVTFKNTHENRKIAFNLPVPNLMGLVNMLKGTLVGHYANKHIEGIVYEGGQHTLSSSVLNMEAIIVQMLVIHNMVKKEDIDPDNSYYQRLSMNHKKCPHFLVIQYRHPVIEGDGFQMRPGFENFYRVKKGDLLATDNTGEIRATMNGRIILPLYQGLGEDGFFLAKDMSSFRLRMISKIISFIKHHFVYPKQHNRYFDKF